MNKVVFAVSRFLASDPFLLIVGYITSRIFVEYRVNVALQQKLLRYEF
jgi:hypothetical protein